jgi:uncharacterized protein Usg
MLKIQPVTLHILYYMPDYRHILQEFVWAYDDQIPDLHRTHKFLWHWKHNIQAVVSEVRLGVAKSKFTTYASVDDVIRMM